jgi:hypothetical protein
MTMTPERTVLSGLRAALPLVLALCAGSAFAEPYASRHAPTISNMDRDQILQWIDKLNVDLGGKAYGHVKDEGRHKIEASEAEIRHLLQDVRSLDALDDTQKVALFNETQAIIAVLNDSEKDRLICERERVTGSHRPVVLCMTVEERRKQSDITKQALFDSQRVHKPIPRAGGS